MLKRFFWILFAILMITGSGQTAYAQDNFLYIQLTLDPSNSDYPQEFLDKFKVALSELGLTPVFIKQYDPSIHPKFWEHQAINLILVKVGGTYGITLTPFINMELSPSPILEAAFDLTTSIVLPENNMDSLNTSVDLAVGISLYASHQCTEAIPYLRRVLQAPSLNPSYPATLSSIEFYIANCTLISGDLDQSITSLEQLIPKDHTQLTSAIGPITNLAWAYFERGDKQAAFDLMEQGIQALDEQNSISKQTIPLFHTTRILSHRAMLNSLNGDYHKAVMDINRAISIMEDNSISFAASQIAELYTLRGQTYLYLYEWDNVLADYNKALELDPDYIDAYFLRGVLYYSILQTGTENYPLALSDFQRYLELAPDGEHAADASKYADQIQTQQEALNS